MPTRAELEAATDEILPGDSVTVELSDGSKVQATKAEDSDQLVAEDPGEPFELDEVVGVFDTLSSEGPE